MKKLGTWRGRSTFMYEGSVPGNVIIYFGKGQRRTIAPQQWNSLLAHFSGRTVKTGTSRDNPPRGSLGKWLQENVTGTAIASYVAPILVDAGFGERVVDDNSLIHIFTTTNLPSHSE